MTSLWVFNASPLILLGKAGELHWVPRLGEVVVPDGVAAEIAQGPMRDPARQWLGSVGASYIRTAPPPPSHLLSLRLGLGETSVLAWALIHPEYEAVLDDAAARRAAKSMGVPLRGTLGLVVLAKRRGLLTSCGAVFERLRGAGLFLNESLVAQSLKAAGE